MNISQTLMFHFVLPTISVGILVSQLEIDVLHIIIMNWFVLIQIVWTKIALKTLHVEQDNAQILIWLIVVPYKNVNWLIVSALKLLLVPNLIPMEDNVSLLIWMVLIVIISNTIFIPMNKFALLNHVPYMVHPVPYVMEMKWLILHVI